MLNYLFSIDTNEITKPSRSPPGTRFVPAWRLLEIGEKNMKKQFKLLITLLFMMPLLAHAQSDWNFQLSPYLWFAGIEGDVATIPGLPVAPIEFSPSDALHDTEASLMLLFEAKKQRHGVLLDFLYSDVQSEEDLIPEVNLTMKSTSRTTLFSAAYLYELYNKEHRVIDLFRTIKILSFRWPGCRWFWCRF